MLTKVKRLRLLPLLLLALSLSGCSMGGLTKLAGQLKNDPATVSVRVTTIYGNFSLTRLAPNTNTASHTISPDGTITVERRQ